MQSTQVLGNATILDQLPGFKEITIKREVTQVQQ